MSWTDSGNGIPYTVKNKTVGGGDLPDPPIILSPTNNEANVSLTPTISIADFVGDNLIHSFTEYIIENRMGEVVYNSGRRVNSLTSITVPPNILSSQKQYRLKVRVGSTNNTISKPTLAIFTTKQEFGPENPDPTAYPNLSNMTHTIPPYVKINETVNIKIFGGVDPNSLPLKYSISVPLGFSISKDTNISENEVLQLTALPNHSQINIPKLIKITAINTVGNTTDYFVNTLIIPDPNALPNVTNFNHTFPDRMSPDVATTFFFSGVTDPNGGPISYNIGSSSGLIFSKTTDIATGEIIEVYARPDATVYNVNLQIEVIIKNTVNNEVIEKIKTMVISQGEMLYDTPGEFLFTPPSGIQNINAIIAGSNYDVTEFGGYLRNDVVMGSTSYLNELEEPQNGSKAVMIDDDTLIVVDGQVYTELGQSISRNPKIKKLTISTNTWMEYPDLTGTISIIKNYKNTIYCAKLYTKTIYKLNTAESTPVWTTLPDTLDIIDYSDNIAIDESGNIYHTKISDTPTITTYKYNNTTWSLLTETDTGIDLGNRSFSVVTYRNKIRMVINNSSRLGIGWELNLDSPDEWLPVPGFENLFDFGGIESMVNNELDVIIMMTVRNKLVRFHRSGLETLEFADLNDVFDTESINSSMVINSKGDIIIAGGLRVNDKSPMREIRKINIRRDIINYDQRITTIDGFIMTGDLPFEPGPFAVASGIGGYRRSIAIQPSKPIPIRVGNNGCIRLIWGNPNFPA